MGNEEQANAEYPTEFKKEKKEVAKFSDENIDVENVTNISAQININGKTMATTNKSNTTENIIENTITSRNEENTSIYIVDSHNKQQNAEYRTEEEEREEASKCSTKLINVSKNSDIEEQLLDQNDIKKDIKNAEISSNEQSRAPTSESTLIKDCQGIKMPIYIELEINSTIPENFENVEDFHAENPTEVEEERKEGAELIHASKNSDMEETLQVQTDNEKLIIEDDSSKNSEVEVTTSAQNVVDKDTENAEYPPENTITAQIEEENS